MDGEGEEAGIDECVKGRVREKMDAYDETEGDSAISQGFYKR